MPSDAIVTLNAALGEAAARRPTVGGFPYFAETLHRNGVHQFTYWLPAMQCLYRTDLGAVLTQDAPLHQGIHDVPEFDEAALVSALRADQAGQTTFPEFAEAAWRAGVVHFVVDLDERSCTYVGLDGQTYVERFAAVAVCGASSRATEGPADTLRR